MMVHGHMSDALKFLDLGCELVPLHEGGRIPRVPWRYQPKTRVVTLERLEWWLSRGVTAWARLSQLKPALCETA